MILSTGARWLLRLAAAAVLTFIYAPLVLVALNAFSTSVTFAWPPPGYTLRWWQAAAYNEGVRTALLTSVVVIVVGLTYFPVVALGPVVEHLVGKF